MILLYRPAVNILLVFFFFLFFFCLLVILFNTEYFSLFVSNFGLFPGPQSLLPRPMYNLTEMLK